MLSRRAGESVVIGDDVVVTVLEVRGDVVRLGIRAPRSVQVHREEVFRELQRANQAAAASSTDRAEQVLSALLRPPDPAAPPRPPKPTKPPKPPKPA